MKKKKKEKKGMGEFQFYLQSFSFFFVSKCQRLCERKLTEKFLILFLTFAKIQKGK